MLLIDEVDDSNCGVLTATLFAILSMQFGLTGLDPDKRFIQLYKIVHLICACVQDYIYRMVDKLLKYLNGSHNRLLNR